MNKTASFTSHSTNAKIYDDLEAPVSDPAPRPIEKPSTTKSEPSTLFNFGDEKSRRTCVTVTCCIVCAGILALVLWGISAAAGDGGGGDGGYGGHGGGAGAAYAVARGSKSGGRGGRGGGSSGGRGGSCFPAGELVLLDDMSAVRVEDIKAGRMTSQGGRVLATMKLETSEEDPLYHYNKSVYVTGSHLVEETGQWVAVEDSDLALAHEENPDFVYNLITSEHKMVINSTLFADWEEWEDCEANWALERKLLDSLNGGRIDLKRPLLSDNETITEGGFEATTPIALEDGSMVSIDKIQPGDSLRGHDNIVFAAMEVWVPSDTRIYRYRGVEVTEWTIVLDEDGFWRNVRNCVSAEPIGYAEDKVWYQLWTTTHQVPTETNLLFADYHAIDENDSIFTQEL